jgi:tetratricopeptide (TPR) repeat protein
MFNQAFRLAPAVSFAATLFVVLPAAAEETTPTSTAGTAPSGLELSEQARSRYEAGDYARALELFDQAYARDPDPNLLFNSARCHEKLGDTAAALDKYEAFLASPNADPDGLTKAQASRDALVKSQGRRAANAEKRPGRSAFGDADGSRQDSSGGSSHLASWLLLGAGVAAAASGVVVYSLGVSDHNDVEEQSGYGDPTRVAPMTQRQAEQRIDSGNTKKLVGGLLLGGGGALLASSAVLFLLAPGQESNVGFDVSPRGGSVAIRGRF